MTEWKDIKTAPKNKKIQICFDDNKILVSTFETNSQGAIPGIIGWKPIPFGGWKPAKENKKKFILRKKYKKKK